MWKLKDFGSSLENAFGTYSETEILVREATCEQPWGPTHKQMEYLCDLCDNEPEYSELMNMLWFRITYNPQKSWRRVYKGLLILDFLVKNGPIKVVHDVAENLQYLEQIKLYQYMDENDQDKTINIKHRANEIRDLIEDHSRLRKERKTMQNLRTKMNGTSNEFSKKVEKSLAIKTKTFISDIIDKVSSNNTPTNNKSFYQSSEKVFKKSFDRYGASKRSSNKSLYTDDASSDNERSQEITSNQNYISKVVELDTITTVSNPGNDTDDFGDFGDFVGGTSPINVKSTSFKTDNTQNGDLFDIFGESSAVSNTAFPTGNNTDPISADLTSSTINTINTNNLNNDIFSAFDMNQSTTNTNQPTNMNVPFANNTHTMSGTNYFDIGESGNAPNVSIPQNFVPPSHPGFKIDPFAIPADPTNVKPNTSAATIGSKINTKSTTSDSSTPIDLDSLINKNIKF